MPGEEVKHKAEQIPENAIFCGFGDMPGMGTLIGVGILDSYRPTNRMRNDPFFTSARAASMPRHRDSIKTTRMITVIDGRYNKCARRVLERDRAKIDKHLNLLLDLNMPKVRTFKPFKHAAADSEQGSASHPHSVLGVRMEMVENARLYPKSSLAEVDRGLKERESIQMLSLGGRT
ncbi:MAG: hypothetical protein ACUVT7_01880 [Thermoplasmata archaeon]